MARADLEEGVRNAGAGGRAFVDLYCGAGLFSAGFLDHGFEPRLAVDLSRDAVASYVRNVSSAGRAGSVADWADADVPSADVLIAGPPCQGFSTLGRQDPLDERNGLALDVVRWARLSGADVVVVENVPPFLKSPQWRSLAARLRRQGYSVATWILDAFDFGAPQVRRRAFTVASRIGPVLVPRPIPPDRRPSAGSALSAPMAASDPMHRWPSPRGVAARRIALVPPRGDKRDLMRISPELCPPSWSRVGCQATDVWGRIDPDRPANTLRCAFQNPSKGRYLHPTEDRTLSLREGARLQGVSDDWILVGRSYSVARQIGNGVPIPLARAVARAVREALDRRDARRDGLAQTA